MNVQFTLRQLAYFVTTADSGSIQAAADELFLSQSAMSSALADLERALGTQLFVRQRGKGRELTPAGHALLAKARRLLAEAEELQAAADDEQSALRGPLTIGCFEVFAPSLLPRLIAGFTQLHPAVDIDFIEADGADLVRLLQLGRVDVAIMFEGQTATNLVTAVIAEPTPHVLVPAGHPVAGLRDVSLADLADEPLILIDSIPSRDFVLGAFQSVGVEPRIRFRSANLAVVRGLVARGLGFTFFAQGSRRDGVPDPDGVVAIPIRDEIHTDAMVLARLPEVQLTRRVQSFWDYAATALPR